MTLSAGERLGPYEILSPLGSGGMGRVYRARDTRLGREVALKVLPRDGAGLAPDALPRFAQEARSASALNHPGIVTVHELGEADGEVYIAMELVDGTTLRDTMRRGKPSVRKAVSLAADLAEALAAAHARGIVHRDLKPENVMVTRDGRAKIVDFGLAKPVLPAADPRDPTLRVDAGAPPTEPGTLLGSVGYMSPEQASGAPVDFRSDQFALASVVYETVEGKKAFAAPTAAETLAAIIREPAPPVSMPGPDGDELRWILGRCHAKEPSGRYDSTRDLARDLRRLDERFGRRSASRPPARHRRMRVAATLLAAAAVLFGVALAARRIGSAPALPLYRQLTFRRGSLWSARFSPDGATIVYAAAWDGEPFRLYSTRFPATSSRPVGAPGTNLLAVSRSGELAVAVRCRPVLAGMTGGTLARLPLEGGVPREVLDGVLFADWAPDAESLAIVRSADGEFRLEYPPGKVLYRTSGWISHPRFSPDGKTIAFLDHPVDPDDRGRVAAIDLAGRRRNLTPEWPSVMGLAWSPDGREVWFAATGAEGGRAIRAVSLSGGERLLARVPGDMTLQDVSGEGRVLATRDDLRIGIAASGEGEPATRDVSWLDRSLVTDVSGDGATLLFTEFGEGGGERYTAFLRRPGDPVPLPLGDGFATSLASDGSSALSVRPGVPPEILVLPAGAGAVRRLRCGDVLPAWAVWFPSRRKVLVAGARPGQEVRLWEVDSAGGEPRPVSARPVALRYGGGIRISPDERLVAAIAADDRVTIFPTGSSGTAAAIPGLEPGFIPLRWSRDGASLYVCRYGEVPSRVVRVDVATGKQEAAADLVPPDPAGVIGIPSVELSDDGKTRVFSYARSLAELYLVTGLR